MSEYGMFLERLFGAEQTFETVRAVIHQWEDESLEMRAGYSKQPFGRLKVPPEPEEQTATIKKIDIALWGAPPERYRVEVAHQRDSQVAHTLEVVNGGKRWQRDHEGHVEIEEQPRRPKSTRHACPSEYARHFDNHLLREIVSNLVLVPEGRVQTAGRDCVRLRAVPLAGGRLWPHWIPHGADDYELHADFERGVLLYIGGRFGGELFDVSAVGEVAFDEPLDEALFSYTPLFGEQVAPATPIVEHLTLEEAMVKAAFALLVPTRLPQGLRALGDVMYHPPRLPAGRATVALMYSDSNHARTMWIEQADEPPPELDELEWETAESGGQSIVISDVEGEQGYRVVVIEREGTHVKLWSNVERPALLDVAASLVPAASRDRH